MAALAAIIKLISKDDGSSTHTSCQGISTSHSHTQLLHGLKTLKPNVVTHWSHKLTIQTYLPLMPVYLIFENQITCGARKITQQEYYVLSTFMDNQTITLWQKYQFSIAIRFDRAWFSWRNWFKTFIRRTINTIFKH